MGVRVAMSGRSRDIFCQCLFEVLLTDYQLFLRVHNRFSSHKHLKRVKVFHLFQKLGENVGQVFDIELKYIGEIAT